MYFPLAEKLIVTSKLSGWTDLRCMDKKMLKRKNEQTNKQSQLYFENHDLLLKINLDDLLDLLKY